MFQTLVTFVNKQLMDINLEVTDLDSQVNEQDDPCQVDPRRMSCQKLNIAGFVMTDSSRV